jgi:flagellin-like hook-associated protein FlgL
LNGINTNINATVARNAIARNQRAMDISMERLSTGLRINSAKDDAAGMAIGARMSSAIVSNMQASRNANDGISMLQTAEGALGEVQKILGRLQELAVTASSGTYGTSDRHLLNTEFTTLRNEVQRILSDTTWNRSALFSAKTINIQGASGAADSISLDFENISLTTLGKITGNFWLPKDIVSPSVNEVIAASVSSSLTRIPDAEGNWTKATSDLVGDSGQGVGDVSLSEDGSVMAVGRYGVVQTYQKSGGEWVQKGNSISGLTSDDNFGDEVILNSDGNILFVAHPNLNSGGPSPGAVTAYKWNGSAWLSMGNTITAGLGTGNSIAIDSSGEKIAVLSSRNNAFDVVRTYDWNGSNWQLTGEIITDENMFQNSGRTSLSMSNDGNVFVIGSPRKDKIGVYDRVNGNWIIRGSEFNNGQNSDHSGWSVDISSDGDTVVIGSPDINQPSNSKGSVSVHDWNGSEWIMRGGFLPEPDQSENQVGYIVAISSNGNSVAYSGPNRGYGWVKISDWNGTEWASRGELLTDTSRPRGEAFGRTLDLSADGVSLAVGDPSYNSGKVSFYEWPSSNTLKVIGKSEIDFSSVSLNIGDRITLDIGDDRTLNVTLDDTGLVSALTSLAVLASNRPEQFGAATASNNVLTLTGLSDGSTIPSIVVSIEFQSTEKALTNASLATQHQSQESLDTITKAITDLSTRRAEFGSSISKLYRVVDSAVSHANATKNSLSIIQDANYAVEATLLARSQIISQASTAMLAQANQNAQTVLALIR